MKNLGLIICLLMASPAVADNLLGRYVAFIGQDDLYNSNGARLSEPWQILRQDRANYHRFGISQPGDEWDSFFGSVDNRATMERMLRNGYINPVAARNVVNGGTMVVVRIYGTRPQDQRVEVDVFR